MLDQFTVALHQLRETAIDPRLQSQILPELPPEEQSNTLADWANQDQLLTTFRLLVEDREAMMVCLFWNLWNSAPSLRPHSHRFATLPPHSRVS